MDLRESSRARRWQKFARELGVIVLGVLIALGAEQAMTTWHERSQMRELRVAVDNEIAQGLGVWQGRVEQQACLETRLDELSRWLQGWREGKPQNLLGPISAPRSGPSGTSVWESRDPAVMTQMPLQAKLAYAGIYDEFANNEVQRLDERMAWLALGEFDGALFLDHGAQMRLQGLITRARWRAGNIANNLIEAEKAALEMGIKPIEYSFEPESYAPLCAPILSRP